MGDAEYREALTGRLAHFAELAGVDAAVRISQAFGGTRLYIPEKPDPDTRLVRAIGIEAATPICEVYGRDSIDIPKGVGLRATIVGLHKQGKSINEIAEHVNRSARWVRKVLQRAGRTGRHPQQLKLDFPE